tara:strand:- start:45 stop:407 length:363 start_codon:yes stop_codon:yes gene_type:complete
MPAAQRMSVFLCFRLEALTSSLWCGPYTPKQKSLFAQVDQLRSEGCKWTEIAKALKDQGITTPRGKQWMGAHTHSVLKKGKIRRLRLGAEAETRVARQRVQKHQINNAANNDSCFDAEMP